MAEPVPEATAAMEQAMAAAFAAGAGGSGGSAGQVADTAPQRTPEEAAMAGLYERMADLPPQLRMFMRGCPRELEAKRHRINCRELVMRNLLSLFEVRRHRREPLLVVWDQRDAFAGEDEPPVAFDWPWPSARAIGVDALGQAQPAEVLDGRLKLQVSLTPVFVSAG